MSDRTLYFEDFAAGQQFESTGRTITEADLTMFAMLSGDWHPMHCDREFAASTRFGQRVVHGALGIAFATGFMHALGIFERSIIAMMDLREWQFKAPLKIGDTLRLVLSIVEVQPGRSGRSGRVRRRFELINQEGAVVQRGESDALVKVRPQPEQETTT